MKTKEILNYLEKKIHSVIIATVDDKGLPVTCAIDIMDGDENGLYFLTAKGKGFYNRLKKSGYAALTGMNGRDTLSCVAISVRGKVREIGNAPLQKLFEKNPYMNEIYPTEKSRQALTVFQLYEGSGEWFDLSQKPIERASRLNELLLRLATNKQKCRAMRSHINAMAVKPVNRYVRRIVLILR